MKKLLVAGLMIAVLSITAQANAYVLVYNLFGNVQAVDTAANDQVTQWLSGYIVLNVNDADGIVDDSSVILYGRQGRQDRFYAIDDDIVSLTTYGKYAVLVAGNGQGNVIILTGRLRSSNIGDATRQQVAASLSGAMTMEYGQLFDTNELLTGGGTMRATLNRWLTRSANSSDTVFDDLVDSILSYLESRGYQQPEDQEVPPPLPN